MRNRGAKIQRSDSIRTICHPIMNVIHIDQRGWMLSATTWLGTWRSMLLPTKLSHMSKYFSGLMCLSPMISFMAFAVLQGWTK
jgi:hypothetical protein